jgi:hypothetical protein
MVIEALLVEGRAGYSPVVCVDEENNCEKIPNICERGPCLQDECFFEKYCYRLEDKGKGQEIKFYSGLNLEGV